MPGFNERVRKVECVYSFDTPESPEGLFVSMSNFQGLSAHYIDMEFAREKRYCIAFRFFAEYRIWCDVVCLVVAYCMRTSCVNSAHTTYVFTMHVNEFECVVNI